MEIKNRLLVLVLVMIAAVFVSVSLNLTPASGEQVLPPATLTNIALGKACSLSIPPSYPLTTDQDDVTQLTDGEYAEGLLWADKLTVGWGEPDKPTVDITVVITIDLGSVESIRGASFSTAALESSGVFWPVSIKVLVSDDGKAFRQIGDLIQLSAVKATPPKPKTQYSKYRFWTGELEGKGQYVQLQVKAPGQYIFADEIEVYKGE